MHTVLIVFDIQQNRNKLNFNVELNRVLRMDIRIG